MKKNGKFTPLPPFRQVKKENKKIEKYSIYGDSYIQEPVGGMAEVAVSNTTDFDPPLETNSVNSLSL